MRFLALPVAMTLLAVPAAAQMDSARHDEHHPSVDWDVTGRVQLTAFFNNGEVNNADVPQWALPPATGPGLPTSGSGASARQSLFRLSAWGSALGTRFRGEIEADFFGGQLNASGGNGMPLVRLRRFRADVSWPRVFLMLGQESPPLWEIDPSSLVAVGVPGFGSSGNLWRWIPQARLRAEIGGGFRAGLEAAALAPSTGEARAEGDLTPDLAELSRRPFLQGRVVARWGSGPAASEVSVGGHLGWLATDGDSLLSSDGVAGSARFFVTRFVEIRGEAYSGKLLNVFADGAPAQSVGVGGVPVGSDGGWVQLNIHPTAAWELGGGFGIDDPVDADLDPATARFKNVSYEAHLHWRPAPLVLGFEFRRIETTYDAATGTAPVNHLGVAAGFTF